MGIGLPTLEAMCWAYARCGAFGKALQISRQGLYINHDELPEADQMLRNQGFPSYREVVGDSQTADQKLIPLFGADQVHTSDASDYEGAEIIWDFNLPIPSDWHGRYDTILDGGSLEHIFNVPVALANMMNLLRVGGRLISVIPANNWLGHGFYQFGTELPYRVFQPENGFKCVFVCLAGLDGGKRLIEQTDKGADGGRNEIGCTHAVIDLVFCAQKIADIMPFQRWPQQGDYAAAWAGAS